MEKFPLQKIKRRRRSQALQNAPLLGNLNHFFISQAVQISLRDTDILVTQKTADGIEVCSHFDLLLGKEVTAGMRADTDILYPFSVPLQDMLYC